MAPRCIICGQSAMIRNPETKKAYCPDHIIEYRKDQITKPKKDDSKTNHK